MLAKEEGSTSWDTILKRGKKGPRKKSLDKLKDAIRSKTRRNNGRSMKANCIDLNRTLKGWYEYFKHSESHVFCRDRGLRARTVSQHPQKAVETKGPI